MAFVRKLTSSVRKIRCGTFCFTCRHQLMMLCSGEITTIKFLRSSNALSPRSCYSNIWWHAPPTTWPILWRSFNMSSCCITVYGIYSTEPDVSHNFIFFCSNYRQHSISPPKIVADSNIFCFWTLLLAKDLNILKIDCMYYNRKILKKFSNFKLNLTLEIYFDYDLFYEIPNYAKWEKHCLLW